MTVTEKKAIEEKFDADLQNSQMSAAYKQELKERQVTKVNELSEIKAIRGLEKANNRRPKITLANGLQVNADAFDD